MRRTTRTVTCAESWRRDSFISEVDLRCDSRLLSASPSLAVLAAIWLVFLKPDSQPVGAAEVWVTNPGSAHTPGHTPPPPTPLPLKSLLLPNWLEKQINILRRREAFVSWRWRFLSLSRLGAQFPFVGQMLCVICFWGRVADRNILLSQYVGRQFAIYSPDVCRISRCAAK